MLFLRRSMFGEPRYSVEGGGRGTFENEAETRGVACFRPQMRPASHTARDRHPTHLLAYNADERWNQSIAHSNRFRFGMRIK